MDLCRARRIWKKKSQESGHGIRGDEIAESIIADYENGKFIYSKKEKKPTSSASTPSTKRAKQIQSSNTTDVAPEDESDEDDDNSDVFSYGLPDIPSFIANNAKAWGGNLPDEDDWNKIRFEGS